MCFDEDDEEIIKLASNIKCFRCEGLAKGISEDSEDYNDDFSLDESVGDYNSDSSLDEFVCGDHTSD